MQQAFSSASLAVTAPLVPRFRPPPGLEDLGGLCWGGAGLEVGRRYHARQPQARYVDPVQLCERKAVLVLDERIEVGGSLPSVGSAAHHAGLCKPCDFLHRSRDGCTAGAKCGFCHLCGPDENRRRKMMKKKFLKTAWQSGPLAAAA